MSYYHYFKLKKDSKYNSDEYPNKWKFRVDNSSRDKTLLKASMINSYYEPNLEKKLTEISVRVKMITYSIVESCTESYVKEIKQSGELYRNRPRDEYEMERLIEEYEDKIDSIIESLLILATVRFVPDDTYSDTPKNEMDYLKCDYINRVEEEIEYLEDISCDYAFAKFATEECTRETEDERYNKEHPNEE